MTNPADYPQPPDPEANRAQWAADHPAAQPVTQDEAAGQVAAQLGGGAPDAGVPGDELGQQMADAGASPGLPYEEQMNALMEQVKSQQAQIQGLIERDQAREKASIAALGEPILQRYANGVRDKLTALSAANPGGGGHFAQVIADAGKLADAAANAISRGASDFGTVRSYWSRVDRFLSSGHKRTAQGHLAHVDLSAAASDLEQVAQEADRLGGDTPATAVQAHAITSA